MVSSANAINVPATIAIGGTNATSMSTSTGIVKYDGTSLITSSTALIDSSNRQTNTSQPAFLATLSNAVSNVTGDGTDYTIIFDSEIFDNGSNYNPATGIFTAPVTGRYQFNMFILAQNAIATNTASIAIMTSNRGYTFGNYASVNNVGNYPISFSVLADMDASDTATCHVIFSGGTKTVGLYAAPTDVRTAFSGYLVC